MAGRRLVRKWERREWGELKKQRPSRQDQNHPGTKRGGRGICVEVSWDFKKGSLPKKGVKKEQGGGNEARGWSRKMIGEKKRIETG